MPIIIKNKIISENRMGHPLQQRNSSHVIGMYNIIFEQEVCDPSIMLKPMHAIPVNDAVSYKDIVIGYFSRSDIYPM